MKTGTTISISAKLLQRVRKHLLQPNGINEEAAFLLASWKNESLLEISDAIFVAPKDFLWRSRTYLELADGMRAEVIKKAHDSNACLIECHSHPGQIGACFSWSDLHGFDDFVPHVLWRLKSQPYTALVFAADSIDAIFWRTSKSEPEPLEKITTEDAIILPTGLTHLHWSEIYERQPL